ncbi:MAG: ATP synthase A1 subunit C [Actinomycetota bacterium]|nr:ATP synthase A1 subunit C [Actinomycetota bacterium]
MSSGASTTRKASPGGKDYGYSNARIRGMKSRLLDRVFLDSLIAAPEIGNLIQDLSDTEYGPDLEEALIRGRDAAAVDEALKNNMVRTFRKVFGFLNEEAAYILATLLGRWDVFNIKTILRGKHMQLSTAEINEGLLPAGYLTQIDLEALSSMGDIRGVVDTAATWGLPFASAMREGYAEYMRSGELADLELAMDRYFTGWAAARLVRRSNNVQMAKRLLGIQVDILNLVMVFRLQKADMESVNVETFFLEGGRDVGKELYRELGHMSDIDEVLDRLRGTPYGKTLDDVSLHYLETNTIAVFERALEDYLVRKALTYGTGDPLGIGVVIAYLWAKQNEITNLRIIVKGKSVGMPVDRVRGELILV